MQAKNINKYIYIHRNYVIHGVCGIDSLNLRKDTKASFRKTYFRLQNHAHTDQPTVFAAPWVSM